ncbi:16414_t:CDS:2 [Funneliformis geosporum]|nr:16414_t:CDS:2 [Funneliformis geosporum]
MTILIRKIDLRKQNSSYITNFIVLLKTDVFNLADIWTVFRKMSMKYYKLDSSHYVFASSLS